MSQTLSTAPEAGLVPNIYNDNPARFYNEFDSVADIEYLLDQFATNYSNTKLGKTWTLTDCMMHLNTLPTSELLTPDLAFDLSPETHRVLYDTDGVTRKFTLNGIEALRTIPPFYYINGGPGALPDDTSSSLSPREESVPDLPTTDLAYFAETRPSVEVDALFEDSNMEDADDSDSSSSSDSESTTSGSSHGSSSSAVSDSGTVRAHLSPTREVTPYATTEVDRSESRSQTSTSTKRPSPLRASISIEWPAMGGPSHVIYEPHPDWQTIYEEEPAAMSANSDNRTPSPLPSLTPSPPPVVSKSTKDKKGKRRATDAPKTQPPKRRRRAQSDDSDGEFIPDSANPYGLRKGSGASGSSAEPHRASNSRRANKRTYRCLVKDCDSKPFLAAKDRNRHMDTHFGPRFQCPGCLKYFPREDARGRHRNKASSACLKIPITEPAPTNYWRTCPLDMLVCPDEDDPLYSLWRPDVEDGSSTSCDTEN